MKLLTVPPETPAIAMADEESLEQILDNLIDNAIKYTNSGGTITVRWEGEKNCQGDYTIGDRESESRIKTINMACKTG